MRKSMCLWGVLTSVSLALIVGCAKKSEVNTAKLETSFASAEPANKTEVDKAVSSIKAGDYPSALGSLQKVAGQAKLTPEQQQAIKDVIAQIQSQLAKGSQQASGEAQKALDAAKQALPRP